MMMSPQTIDNSKGASRACKVQTPGEHIIDQLLVHSDARYDEAVRLDCPAMTRDTPPTVQEGRFKLQAVRSACAAYDTAQPRRRVLLLYYMHRPHRRLAA